MYQRWEELLFLHWACAPERVAADLPPGLEVDTYDGRAWIGVVPFFMRGVRPRLLPAVAGLSDFPELNLRTYVIDSQGHPGVWFYSLDTPMRLANWLARTFFHLNYRRARMNVATDGMGCRYQSEWWMGSGWDVPQCYEWSRVGTPYQAKPGSLDFFLVERYRLFAYNRKQRKLLTGRVHHEPYGLQSVELGAHSKRLFKTNGLECPEDAPVSVLGSAGVAVEVFPLQLCSNISTS
jgi:uncharacterized protein YqjF (DUF2071 family)